MPKRCTLPVPHLASGKVDKCQIHCRTLTLHRHPHIYGIDLASPSELIAHKRDDNEIARHIGAEKVIFQELEDLVEACASAVVPYATARPNQQFEVGVFNGKYVTPVPRGYFSHLERIRGETKKMKVLEHAREAVANGCAGEDEIKMAINGVKVDVHAEVVPARVSDGNPAHQRRAQMNGKRKHEEENGEKSPEHRMDIGLHNQADFD